MTAGSVKRHSWCIDAKEYERHELRRGRRHAFETLVPDRSALVVVDMVEFFVAENPYTMGIVPEINALAVCVRGGGGTVAWIVPDANPHQGLEAEFYGQRVAATYQSSGGRGAVRQRLWPGLAVAPGDIAVAKSATSAFFPGRSDLHGRLQQRQIETVLIAGTVANVCVESSARDARTLGYRVIVAAEAVSAPNDLVLNATLRTIYRSFGDVRSTTEIKAMFDCDPACHQEGHVG